MDSNPAATISTANQYAHDNLLVILGYNAFDKYPLTADGKFDETAKPLWTDTWEDMLFSPGPRQEYHMSLSGTTNDDLNYYMSFGYLEDKGDMSFSRFQRYSARINVSKRVNKWFETGLSASLNRGIRNAPAAVRTLRYTLDMPDIYPGWLWDIAANDYYRDAQGNKVWDMGRGDNNGWRRGTWGNTSPLAEADPDANQLKNDQDNLSTRGFVNLTLLPGLQFKNTLSADYGAYASYTFWSNEWSWAGLSGGRSSRNKSRDLTLNITNLVTYKKTFGDHKINLLAGHETYALNTNFVSGGSRDFPPGITTLYEVNAGATITDAGSDENNHRIESFLSRVEYSLLDRYYVSASFRRDGTSRFSSDYRWGNFWSVGGSWRISKETFMIGMSD